MLVATKRKILESQSGRRSVKPTGFCVLGPPMLWFLPLPTESWAPGSVLEGKGGGRFSEVMSLSRDLNFRFGLSSSKCVPSSCPVVPNTVLVAGVNSGPSCPFPHVHGPPQSRCSEWLLIDPLLGGPALYKQRNS